MPDWLIVTLWVIGGIIFALMVGIGAGLERRDLIEQAKKEMRDEISSYKQK